MASALVLRIQRQTDKAIDELVTPLLHEQINIFKPLTETSQGAETNRILTSKHQLVYVQKSSDEQP